MVRGCRPRTGYPSSPYPVHGVSVEPRRDWRGRRPISTRSPFRRLHVREKLPAVAPLRRACISLSSASKQGATHTGLASAERGDCCGTAETCRGSMGIVADGGWPRHLRWVSEVAKVAFTRCREYVSFDPLSHTLEASEGRPLGCWKWPSSSREVPLRGTRYLRCFPRRDTRTRRPPRGVGWGLSITSFRRTHNIT